MSQPVAIVKVADAEYVFEWLKKLFHELRLLRSNKLTVELIRPGDGQKSYIKITRRG